MSGTKVKYDVEEAFTVTSGDCDKTETEAKSTDGGNTYSQIGLWICAIILIIFFTMSLWCGFNMCNSYGGKGKKKGTKGGEGGCGMIGGCLVWLIIVIIFLCAVWKCGWGAIAGFFIIIVILAILFWMWSCFGREDCKDHSSRY